MKKIVSEFIRRGLTACGFGPIVLVVFYLIMQRQGLIEMLTVNEVCLSILSLSVLAFIAGGMNVIYQIERLPLMVSIFIHGIVLYISYLATYLLNDWLERSITPILIFSCIFVLSFFIIWLVIYSVIKRNADQLNTILQEKRHTSKEG